MNGRKTHSSKDGFQPRKYQSFRIKDVPEEGVFAAMGDGSTFKLLSWKGNGVDSAMTANVTLAQGFKKETGSFSANVEFFVLRGVLKIGNFVYRKHSYSYIPAGQVLGEWSVEAGDKTDDLVGQMEDGDVEIVWMQDGACSFTAGAVAESDSFHEDFIPIIDAFCMPWGGTQTSQFAVSRKKWLRKNASGGGVWLLHVLPHFDSKEPFVQNYVEEAVCLGGSCEYGEHNIVPGEYTYVPHGTVSPRHISFEGSLFFIKVNRDLSLPGRVASYQPLALPSEPSIDWSTKDPSTLPGPCPWVPKAFVRHIGSWEGTYTHITKQGEVTDKHFCRLDIGIHGKYYSQRNTYTWKAEDGSVTKKEVYLFHGEFDKSGFCRIDSEKIVGWGTVIDAHDESSGSIIFYGSYKAPPKPDTFDLIRMFNKEGTKRFRTWQVKLNDDLLKIVHVEEEHTRLENDMWIPRPVGINQS